MQLITALDFRPSLPCVLGGGGGAGLLSLQKTVSVIIKV